MVSIHQKILAVIVGYQSHLFQDGFESGDTTAWSETVPTMRKGLQRWSIDQD